MDGRQVLCLERRLRALGLQHGYVDSYYGDVTHRAVLTYQHSRRLVEDGVTGPQTAGSMGIWHESPWCNRAAKNISGRHRESGQILLVKTATWSSPHASVQLAKRVAGRWTCSAPLPGMVGRAGIRRLRDRRSGDGTTPAGVFPLGRIRAWDGDRLSFFGNGSDPGVPAGLWRQVRHGDCYGATAYTSRYGHLVHRPYCTSPDEYLPNYQQAYVRAAIIGANTEPNVSGDEPGETPYASAIFLHRHSYGADGSVRPTAGCVSLAGGHLSYVLSHLNTNVRFAIGTPEHLYHHA